jgi:trimeric autotransporter adhesin
MGAEVEIATITSTAAVSLVGNGADNLLTGNAAANALSGGDGNDTLNGGIGNDILIGGLGNDTLNGDADNDILGGGDNNDILNGGIGNDTLFGELGNDSLNGGAGNDTLAGGAGDDTLAGGTGDDVYVIDDANDTASELAASGSDRIDTGLDQYVLGVNIENLRYTGGGNFTGTGNALANVITSSTGNDTLNGLAGNDSLNGNAGDDRLDGGTGIDRLVGGMGNDTYVVNTTAVTDPVTGVVTYTVDAVVELLGEGSDTVEVAYTVAGTHTLAANVENGVITATIAGVNLTGNTLDNDLIGNLLANKLTGGAGNDTLNGLDGNDTLDGGAGSDSLVGGLGNDTYVVDHVGDVLVEQADGGTDSASVAIATATTYALGEHVENATVTSTAAVSLVGNGADNLLTGNAAANRLEGGAGNDTLDGKAGLDSFVGGTGDDTYIIDQAGELARIIESADEGSDTLKIAYANASTTVAQTVSLTGNLTAIDNVTVSGSGLFNVTGNELDNSLTGNGSANVLDGGLGSDTLIGLGGNDTLIGGERDDVLIGGAGNDLLNGGAGADRFVFTSKLTADADRVADFADGDLLFLQGSVFTALGASGALDPNAFALGTAATTAAQHVIYDGSTGNLYYDADGSGVGAKVLVAALNDHPVLDAGDFWVA